MQEQIPLNFSAPLPVSYESMTLQELQDAYLKHVGYPSRPCANEREIILNALEKERTDEIDRLRTIDTANDQDELSRPYRIP